MITVTQYRLMYVRENNTESDTLRTRSIVSKLRMKPVHCQNARHNYTNFIFVQVLGQSRRLSVCP